MAKTYIFFQKLFQNESGQGMVEYGLILGLIAVLIIGTLSLIGDELLAMFQTILAELQ
jgi:pilus assembly protein Flp/PilA